MIAIDGRCGSGKTTLAARLAAELGCPVIHTDDYYLPLDRRCAGWEKKPAANIDFDRLRNQLLLPLHRGEAAEYRPYSCREGAYLQPAPVPSAPVILVEGSYSQHPALRDLYDLKIVLTCSDSCQTARLQNREGERFELFRRRWIPLERSYLSDCRIQEEADLLLDTTGEEV